MHVGKIFLHSPLNEKRAQTRSRKKNILTLNEIRHRQPSTIRGVSASSDYFYDYYSQAEYV